MVVRLNGFDESTLLEIGALVLNFLSKCSTLSGLEDGSLVSNDLTKQELLVGNVKTVDNINLIQNTIQKSMQQKGLNDLSQQLEIFDDALNCVMDIPGDWHARLAMQLSI